MKFVETYFKTFLGIFEKHAKLAETGTFKMFYRQRSVVASETPQPSHAHCPRLGFPSRCPSPTRWCCPGPSGSSPSPLPTRSSTCASRAYGSASRAPPPRSSGAAPAPKQASKVTLDAFLLAILLTPVASLLCGVHARNALSHMFVLIGAFF